MVTPHIAKVDDRIGILFSFRLVYIIEDTLNLSISFRMIFYDFELLNRNTVLENVLDFKQLNHGAPSHPAN